MAQAKKAVPVLMVLIMMGALLIACGKNSNGAADESKATHEAAKETASPESKAAEPVTHIVTDWTGHQVEVPTHPKRVIYHGEVTGDVLALGVTPVGALKGSGTVYDDRLTSTEDIGFPINLEKSMALQPDLIIFSNNDEQQYEQLAKIAPTATFDSFASLENRLRALGDLLGKKDEAEAWLQNYNAEKAAMWTGLREQTIKENETASVFTMYPGNRLFVMAGAGLPQFLYDEQGFKPLAKVQELIDQGTGFIEISAETMQEYAGDRIFILNPVDPAAQESTNELMKGSVWNSIPAVKNGYVYRFDILKASGDALSREWMLQELPKALNP
ncbi:ABC transporter substrate-binding protein [Cohnella faecalis]|uniref:ABC transporter substrate-binding protein n=1 Tax=Cohnella faecalis TaxID=2315694 RepID=A0A398CMJ4_9BACL|nr:ABC transporter substrate-binding protein [Cohnella faecalis]RIE02459.1 ABC transporter substrate-binding protein [Cohnella faecalis]